MWIGLGIVLLIIGAVLSFALDINIPGIDDDVLGWILMAGGVLAIILSFAMTRTRTTRRETYVEPPTRRY